MPELPEVQTVLDTLAYQMGNPVIEDIEIFWENIIDGDTENFRNQLRNHQIQGYRRLGKFLCFDCGDVMWIAHLRMEGKFYLQMPQEPYDQKHVHVIFHLNDGRELRYHDTRKFGRMYVYAHEEDLHDYPCFQKIGFDAFDERLTANWLYQRLHHRNITLKQALLDQSVVAGVGNIYADEICFALGLHPQTRVCRMRKKDFERWIIEMRRILNGAIRAGGTTIRSYTSSLGVDGRFQLQLRVHAKKGERCPICQQPIRKIVVGGRGTYYCAKCQKKR
ncbi:bifunctional DNA-formamidopyrimidine glycosylase/DNA-(apurinic or apyrimidinic site) lyase [Merdibacter massiliensis]|uniref:bifunctional DNA-formamidopyrimidine glycosylase/DNA-(apurinic or apyrimidinic site) lyase n=1 Tax=Merdibacter massiliensis TaxID=1871030 RepID=UPI00096A6387|nr:bifunctional DNA-formamidopyrimidine glycosylase/DNA-(apurinic or apyrimidinic site) lyase [Merdibacter massiliensis]